MLWFRSRMTKIKVFESIRWFDQLRHSHTIILSIGRSIILARFGILHWSAKKKKNKLCSERVGLKVIERIVSIGSWLLADVRALFSRNRNMLKFVVVFVAVFCFVQVWKRFWPLIVIQRAKTMSQCSFQMHDAAPTAQEGDEVTAKNITGVKTDYEPDVVVCNYYESAVKVVRSCRFTFRISIPLLLIARLSFLRTAGEAANGYSGDGRGDAQAVRPH